MYFLLLIHKKGLCKPLHSTRSDERYDLDGESILVNKGFCPLLYRAFDTIKNKI